MRPSAGVLERFRDPPIDVFVEWFFDEGWSVVKDRTIDGGECFLGQSVRFELEGEINGGAGTEKIEGS